MRGKDLRILVAIYTRVAVDRGWPLFESVVKDYPNVLAFQKRGIARPAWKKTFDAYCDRVEAA